MVISTDQSRDPRLNLHTAGAMFTQLEDVQWPTVGPIEAGRVNT